MSKTVLVTGASGYIGKYLVKKLLREGYSVRAWARNLGKMPSWLLGSEKMKVIEGGLMDKSSLEKAIEGVDAVFHLAAVLSMYEKDNQLYKTNILGLKNLLEGCRESGRPMKFIFASSIDTQKRQTTDYGQSKLKGEKIVRNFCRQNSQIQGIIVRIGNVYGPGEEGITGGIKEMINGNNWRSSLLYHCLGDKHLYLVAMENLVKRLVGLIVEERAENKTLTLVDEEITVKELTRRFKRNGLIKSYPEKLLLGQLVFRLWQILGRILKRADLLIYLGLERTN